MKKLVTVVWSKSVEVEFPDHLSNIGVEELEDFGAGKEISELASNAVRDASENLSWKDGVITDIQDA